LTIWKAVFYNPSLFMAEQYRPLEEFNGVALGETLAVQGQLRHDVAHGVGQALELGEQRTLLEVYPDAAVARVTTDSARVEVFRVPGYTVDEDRARVVFEHGPDNNRSRLIVRSDGRVALIPILQADRQPLPTASSDVSVPIGTGVVDADTSQEPANPSATSSEPQRPTPATDRTESDEVPVVTMQGRLGRDPWFRGGDSPLAGFPLAINGPEDKTTWHKVVVFDNTAETLQEQVRRGDVRKGRLVDVTGRTVVREEQTTRGPKSVTEFHATEVTRVRPTRQ
jgi:Single-strand binding protein family